MGFVNRVVLLSILNAHFSEEELRELCFDLSIPYDDLGGRGRAANARELIEYAERRGRYYELVTRCYELRPHANWQIERVSLPKDDYKTVQISKRPPTEDGSGSLLEVPATEPDDVLPLAAALAYLSTPQIPQRAPTLSHLESFRRRCREHLALLRDGQAASLDTTDLEERIAKARREIADVKKRLREQGKEIQDQPEDFPS